MMLTITHEWTCDLCGQTQISADRHVLGMVLRNPWPPDGWHYLTLDGMTRTFCEKHKWSEALSQGVLPWATPQEPVRKS